MKHSVIFVLLFFFSVEAYPQTVIKGKLLGADGKSMLRADIVQVNNSPSFPRDKIKSFAVDNKGNFEFQVSSPNLYRFWFSGSYHRKLELPVYTVSKDTIKLNVKLEPIEFKSNPASVKFYVIRGWDKKASDFPVTQSFEAHKDSLGIYSISVEAKEDTLAYYVDGITKDNRYTHGSHFDYLVPDRESDYYSVLKTEKGTKFNLKVDLKGFPVFNDKEAQYEILDAPSKTKKFLAVHQDYRERKDNYSKYVEGQRIKGKQSYENKYDWSNDIKELFHETKKEPDSFIRKAVILSFLRIDFSSNWSTRNNYHYDKNFAKQVLKEIEPDSPLWSYAPHTLGRALRLASKPDKVYNDLEKEFEVRKKEADSYRSYVANFSENHPDETIKPYLLMMAVSWAFASKQFDLFEKYYAQLQEKFGNTREAESIKRRYGFKREVQAGKKVPDFEFQILKSKQKVSNQSLLGSTYLINFWATWCGPCMPKLDDLHKIHKGFEDKGFKIVNVSINFKKSEVFEVQKRKYPMPWINVHLDGWKPNGPIMKRFEVVTIPQSILVNENGIIEAVNPTQNELVKLLEK